MRVFIIERSGFSLYSADDACLLVDCFSTQDQAIRFIKKQRYILVEMPEKVNLKGISVLDLPIVLDMLEKRNSKRAAK